QEIDVTIEDGAVLMNHLVSGALVGAAQRADQKRRHLTTSHEIVRAEPIVDGWVAATSDPLGGQPLDICLEHMAVVVGECERIRRLRWLRTGILRVRRRLVGATPTTRFIRVSRRLAATV